MEEKMITKFQEMLSINRESAEHFAHEHVKRVQASSFCSKAIAIQSILRIIS